MDEEERFLNDWPDGTSKSFGNNFTKHWDVSEKEMQEAKRLQVEADWKAQVLADRLLKIAARNEAKRQRVLDAIVQKKERELAKITKAVAIELERAARAEAKKLKGKKL